MPTDDSLLWGVWGNWCQEAPCAVQYHMIPYRLEWMSALSPKELRECWIANAKAGSAGTFCTVLAEATRGGLAEGYLGLWAPDHGIKIARRDVALGYALRDAEFVDTCAISKEWARRSAKRLFPYWMKCLLGHMNPLTNWRSRPGYPFIFHSNILGCVVYFKFQIAGIAKSPRVLFLVLGARENVPSSARLK